MTVAVYQPPRPTPKDPMDQLQQALSIATTVYGVAADKQKTDALMEQNRLAQDAAAQEKQRAQAYNFNKDYEQVPKGATNSIPAEQANLFLPSGIKLPEDQAIRLRSYGTQTNQQTNTNERIARDLRSKYETESKDTAAVVGAWNSLDSGLKQSRGSAADDIALIFNYMKVANPGAVVRDFENQLVINGTKSLDDRANSYYDQIKNGHQALTPKQRDDLVNSAKGIVYGRLQNQAQIDQDYIGKAGVEGVDPAKIISHRYQTLNDKFTKEFQDAKQQLYTPGTIIKVGGVKMKVNEDGKTADPIE